MKSYLHHIDQLSSPVTWSSWHYKAPPSRKKNVVFLLIECKHLHDLETMELLWFLSRFHHFMLLVCFHLRWIMRSFLHLGHYAIPLSSLSQLFPLPPSHHHSRNTPPLARGTSTQQSPVNHVDLIMVWYLERLPIWGPGQGGRGFTMSCPGDIKFLDKTSHSQSHITSTHRRPEE